MTTKSNLTVVVPVYNNAAGLWPLLARLEPLSEVWQLELILVDDGSSDTSWDVILEIAKKVPYTSALRLSRNFGQHNALLAGIRESSSEVTVTLDDDLQFYPEDIPKMVDVLKSQHLDVVYGIPTDYMQASWRKFGSRTLKHLLGSSLAISEASSLSSFRVFRTDLRNAFKFYVGPSVSIDALLSWASSKTIGIEVQHSPRLVGKSNYSWKKLFGHAFDIISSYSATPLRVASLFGVLASLFGFGLLADLLIRAVFFGTSVPGFTFLASAISLFAGIQLLTLGIIGEYLARVHFRVMNKPSFNISERVGRLASANE